MCKLSALRTSSERRFHSRLTKEKYEFFIQLVLKLGCRLTLVVDDTAFDEFGR